MRNQHRLSEFNASTHVPLQTLENFIKDKKLSSFATAEKMGNALTLMNLQCQLNNMNATAAMFLAFFFIHGNKPKITCILN